MADDSQVLNCPEKLALPLNGVSPPLPVRSGLSSPNCHFPSSTLAAHLEQITSMENLTSKTLKSGHLDTDTDTNSILQEAEDKAVTIESRSRLGRERIGPKIQQEVFDQGNTSSLVIIEGTGMNSKHIGVDTENKNAMKRRQCIYDRHNEERKAPRGNVVIKGWTVSQG